MVAVKTIHSYYVGRLHNLEQCEVSATNNLGNLKMRFVSNKLIAFNRGLLSIFTNVIPCSTSFLLSIKHFLFSGCPEIQALFLIGPYRLYFFLSLPSCSLFLSLPLNYTCFLYFITFSLSVFILLTLFISLTSLFLSCLFVFFLSLPPYYFFSLPPS